MTISLYLASSLLFQTSILDRIRALDDSKSSEIQAKLIFQSLFEELGTEYAILSNPIYFSEPEIGLYYWEQKLDSHDKVLRWFPKGIISLRSLPMGTTDKIQISSEKGHSKAEAELRAKRIVSYLMLPREWKSIDLLKVPKVNPEPMSLSTARTYSFNYGVVPPSHLYPHPYKSLYILVNSETLAIEEIYLSNYGVIDSARVTVNRDSAINIAKKSSLFGNARPPDPIPNSVGLTYVEPSTLRRQTLKAMTGKLRQAYLVPFPGGFRVFVDAESGEIIRQGISK